MSDVRKRLQRQLSVGMDGEKGRRGVLAFRCRKSLDFSAAGAPEKTVLGTRKREEVAPEAVSPPQEAAAKLPEKYALLASFYEGVEVAVSLLDIRRELCTFQAVCATVEATTKRRFLQKHLAQIKYILPEAIDLEYVRSYDSDTRSNKWELKISLSPMPAEAEEPSRDGEANVKKPKIETVQRRRAFHARLAKFASTHSEEDDVPAHPMPERAFNGSSKATSSGVNPEYSMPVATTCIPMEINTTAHRAEFPQSERSPALPSHFTKSFKSVFSLKAGGSFIRNAKPVKQKTANASPDTINPMRINRTSHRDVHNLAEIPTGTPHLAPSFKSFFSLERSVPEPELVCGDSASVSDMPSSSLLKRRHAAPEEEHEVVLPVELQTPVKIIRTCGASRPPSPSEFESSNKRPHFSPAFKAHFSVGSSSMDASRSLVRTPVKASTSKEVHISWDVRTPGRISDDVHQCSPIDEEASGLRTPVKSSIRSRSFKSPAPVTPKHEHTPCTPQVSECGESSIYVSYHANQPGSASHNGLKSPAATPVKQGSAIRSLFGTPKSDSGSPSTDHVPSTPGVRTPVNASRGSRFRSREAAKQSLGSLFGRSGDDDADCRDGGESSSCITTSSAPRTASLRKSLSFANEVPQAGMNMIQGLPAELVHWVMEEEFRVAEA